jgi:hypothetical protein
VNQVAATAVAVAVAAIKVHTEQKTLRLKKGKGEHHAQGCCICGECMKQTTYVSGMVQAWVGQKTCKLNILRENEIIG